MNIVLQGILIFTGLSTIAWSSNQYRSNFDKRNLIVRTAVGTGLMFLAVAPSFYDVVSTTLSLQSRFVTVSLLGNLFLLLMMFYLYKTLQETQRDIADLSRSIAVNNAAANAHSDGETKPIAVVIPAYNEAKSIGSVVSPLPEQIEGYPVKPIVVSDGSGDATATRAAEAGAIVTEHLINQGQGGALQTGFQVVEQWGAKVVVTMDADGQHPAGELENLVQPVLNNEADYVMGSRHLGVDQTNNGVVRRVGIQFFTWIINLLTKSQVTDCTNGYRAIRGSEVGNLTLTEERFSAPELIIEARKQGLQIMEIPIMIRERDNGETKKPMLGYALGLMRTIIATWIR